MLKVVVNIDLVLNTDCYCVGAKTGILFIVVAMAYGLFQYERCTVCLM